MDKRGLQKATPTTHITLFLYSFEQFDLIYAWSLQSVPTVCNPDATLLHPEWCPIEVWSFASYSISTLWGSNSGQQKNLCE